MKFSSLKYCGWIVSLATWIALFVIGCQKNEQAPFANSSSIVRSIIGGTESLQLPAVGALVRDRVVFCTGTLIAPRLVLTAAHCIDAARKYTFAKNKLQFRMDVEDLQAPGTWKSHFYDGMPNLLTTHPQWDSSRVTNGFDVGVVVLTKAVPKSVASPMPFNASNLSVVWTKKTAFFLGFGLIASAPFGIAPNRKHGVTLNIIQITHDKIFVKGAAKGLCHGDSGGPALGQINGTWHIFGVTSYGNASVVPGSNPVRSRCDRDAISVRTDAFKIYIQGWIDRFRWMHTPSCQQDSDCGTCGSCDAKQNQCTALIGPKTDQHCSPCEQDSDCGKGICWKATYPWRCAANCSAFGSAFGCCPGGSTCLSVSTKQGQREVCLPDDLGCPEVACTDPKGTDCSPHEACKNGKCQLVTLPVPKRHCFPCKVDADCKEPGLLCDRSVTPGRCLPICEKTGLCPKDSTCQLGIPGQQARCVPNNQNCDLKCPSGDASECPANWRCKQGLCQRDKLGKEGSSCTYNGCVAGLRCTQTRAGKLCLRSCGVAPGTTGGVCPRKIESCGPKKKCLPVRGMKFTFCFDSCTNRSDCLQGGECIRGSCVCNDDAQCTQDARCERGFGGDTGFCIKRTKISVCPNAARCLYLEQGHFCAVKASNTRQVGQACDDWAECHAGLNCVALSNQANICLQPCQSARDCKLGGTCHSGYCLCQNPQDCRVGRICKQGFSLGRSKLGVCMPGHAKVPCLMNGECGLGHICQNGLCIVSTVVEPSHEQKAEFSPEPHDKETSKDAGIRPEKSAEEKIGEWKKGQNDSFSENRQKEKPSREKQTDLIDDPASKGPNPAGGCGCSVGILPVPSLVLWFFFLALGLFRARWVSFSE